MPLNGKCHKRSIWRQFVYLGHSETRFFCSNISKALSDDVVSNFRRLAATRWNQRSLCAPPPGETVRKGHFALGGVGPEVGARSPHWHSARSPVWGTLEKKKSVDLNRQPLFAAFGGSARVILHSPIFFFKEERRSGLRKAFGRSK